VPSACLRSLLSFGYQNSLHAGLLAVSCEGHPIPVEEFPQAATQLRSVVAWGSALLALLACMPCLLPGRAARFHHQTQPCHDAGGGVYCLRTRVALASQLLSVDQPVPIITVPLQHLTAVVSG
jgi:hypothetical protein